MPEKATLSISYGSLQMRATDKQLTGKKGQEKFLTMDWSFSCPLFPVSHLLVAALATRY
jgi:hypothetical protein